MRNSLLKIVFPGQIHGCISHVPMLYYTLYV